MTENKANGYMLIDGERNCVFIPYTESVFSEAVIKCLEKYPPEKNANINILTGKLKKFINGELENDTNGNGSK